MKDEVLDKALPSDATVIPRYDVIDANGNVVVTNAQLKLKNPVLQEGTPLDKTTLLKDTTAQILGLSNTATPDDIFKVTAKQTGQVLDQFGKLATVVAKRYDWYFAEEDAIQKIPLYLQIPNANTIYGAYLNPTNIVFMSWVRDKPAYCTVLNIQTHTTTKTLLAPASTNTTVVYSPEYLPNGDIMCACSTGYAIVDKQTAEIVNLKVHSAYISSSDTSREATKLIPLTPNSYVIAGQYSYNGRETYQLRYILNGVQVGATLNITAGTSDIGKIQDYSYLPYYYDSNSNVLTMPIISDLGGQSLSLRLATFQPNSTGVNKLAGEIMLFQNLGDYDRLQSISTENSIYIVRYDTYRFSDNVTRPIDLIKISKGTNAITRPPNPIQEFHAKQTQSWTKIFMENSRLFLVVNQTAEDNNVLYELNKDTLAPISAVNSIGGRKVSAFFSGTPLQSGLQTQSYTGLVRQLNYIALNTSEWLVAKYVYNKKLKESYWMASLPIIYDNFSYSTSSIDSYTRNVYCYDRSLGVLNAICVPKSIPWLN